MLPIDCTVPPCPSVLPVYPTSPFSKLPLIIADCAAIDAEVDIHAKTTPSRCDPIMVLSPEILIYYSQADFVNQLIVKKFTPFQQTGC